jgi:large subunit ribosomal protein L23
MSMTLVLQPKMSEKSYALSKEKNVFVFKVPKNANKHQVGKAVSEQYKVTVASVNIANSKGKSKRTVSKRTRAINGKQNDYKKAYVTVGKGQSLPIFAAIEEADRKAKQPKIKGAK